MSAIRKKWTSVLQSWHHTENGCLGKGQITFCYTCWYMAINHISLEVVVWFPCGTTSICRSTCKLKMIDMNSFITEHYRWLSCFAGIIMKGWLLDYIFQIEGLYWHLCCQICSNMNENRFTFNWYDTDYSTLLHTGRSPTNTGNTTCLQCND